MVSSNSATNEGGAIYSLGTLIVRNSTLTANSALVGSGIFTGSSAATIETTAVTGNLSRASGGGIYNSGSHVTFRNSICSGNQADLDGGGVYHYFGTLLIENSTLTGNVAKRGAGGIYVGGQTVTLRNATVSGNTANTTAGGGIANRSATLTLDNSIVAGNAALNAPLLPDISGSYTGSNNITSGNPFLAPLGDYGGPTQTMPPLPDSPAIDAGGTTTLLTDQRGFPRVGTPDIGAVESQGIADLARFWNRDFDGDGLPYGVEQALGTDNFAADPANSRNLAPPVFDASGHTILSFGLASAALQGTRWILSRSLDLTSGSFAEIYRFDGITDTVSPGVDYIRSASRVTIADSNPPPGSAFYRFEAVLEP
jgi:predicted outer membrane repeat protein